MLSHLPMRARRITRRGCSAVPLLNAVLLRSVRGLREAQGKHEYILSQRDARMKTVAPLIALTEGIAPVYPRRYGAHFQVRDAEEVGFWARALGHAVFTQGETWCQRARGGHPPF